MVSKRSSWPKPCCSLLLPHLLLVTSTQLFLGLQSKSGQLLTFPKKDRTNTKKRGMVKLGELIVFETLLKWDNKVSLQEQEWLGSAEIPEPALVSPKYAENCAVTWDYHFKSTVSLTSFSKSPNSGSKRSDTIPCCSSGQRQTQTWRDRNKTFKYHIKYEY